MIHLKGQTVKGTPLYILGLTATELGGVLGVPLVVHLTGMQAGELEMVLMAGPDEQSIIDKLAAHSVTVTSDRTAAEGEA